ncbi:hypothetical protein RJG79_07685 [Mycoplasmatota bacterium WC44]
MKRFSSLVSFLILVFTLASCEDKSIEYIEYPEVWMMTYKAYEKDKDGNIPDEPYYGLMEMIYLNGHEPNICNVFKEMTAGRYTFIDKSCGAQEIIYKGRAISLYSALNNNYLTPHQLTRMGYKYRITEIAEVYEVSEYTFENIVVEDGIEYTYYLDTCFPVSYTYMVLVTCADGEFDVYQADSSNIKPLVDLGLTVKQLEYLGFTPRYTKPIE